jgi:hypothetical protein
MKKIVVTLAVIFGLGISQSNAQSISGGIKAESNMSNFLLTDMDGFKSNLGFGASLGGFMKLDLSEHFAIQPELMFHFKNSEMETKATGAKVDYQYWGAEIPIYFMGQTALGNGRGYIGLGPYVGFGFDAKYKADGMSDVKLYDEIGNTDKSTMQRWDVGAGLMLGYEFSNRIQINAGYKIGFINALDAGKDDATMLNQTISLGVGYRF